MALGILYGFRGSSVVIVGQGFANNLTQYDDFSSGARFTEADLVPFGLTVERFDVRFETGDVQRGAARQFRAEVEVTDRPGARPHREVLEVNRPLQIGGSTVHLIGHGYAPLVTVKDGEGNVAFSGPVPFLPQDGNFTSAGAIKAPDARPERLGFQAFFLPTAVLDEQGPRSAFPDAVNPALFTNVWYGPPQDRDRPAGERLLPGHHRDDPAARRRRRPGAARADGRPGGRPCPTARAASSSTAGCAGSSSRSATPRA